MALAPPTSVVVSEFMTRGRESAARLEALLRRASSPPSNNLLDLAAQILSCCDRALAALTGIEDASAAGAGGANKRKSDPAVISTALPMNSKRRATSAEAPTRVETKKTTEDGFIWRKYGQKDILKCKNPRLYFRCTYRDDQGCPARRQVQQSEEDPSLYVITYYGEHTCCRQVDALDGEGLQPFVINFGSSTVRHGGGGYSSWRRCDDDVGSEISQGCLLQGEELLRPHHQLNNAADRLEESTPTAAPEPTGSGSPDTCDASPGLEPLDDYYLDWEARQSSFDFINFDQLGLWFQ